MTNNAPGWRGSAVRMTCGWVPALGALLLWSGDAPAQSSDAISMRLAYRIDGYSENIGQIGAVSADGAGRVYVADTHAAGQEIIVFDSAGARVRVLGGRGLGPGEFSHLSPALGWLRDTLVAVEVWGGRRRVTLFGPDGSVRATSTEAAAGVGVRPVFLVGGGDRVYLLEYWSPTGLRVVQPGQAPPPLVLDLRVRRVRADGGTEAVEALSRGDGGPAGLRNPVSLCSAGRATGEFLAPFSDRGPLMAVTPDGGIAVGSGDAYEIDVVQPVDGTRRPFIRREIAAQALTDEAWEEVPEVVRLRRFEELYGQPSRPFGEESGVCPVESMRPSVVPLVRTVLTDEDGLLWVESAVGGVYSLAVYDGEGVLLGEAANPERDPSVAPYVRSGMLYLVTVDEFDIQSVEVYAVSGLPPTPSPAP